MNEHQTFCIEYIKHYTIWHYAKILMIFILSWHTSDLTEENQLIGRKFNETKIISNIHIVRSKTTLTFLWEFFPAAKYVVTKKITIWKLQLIWYIHFAILFSPGKKGPTNNNPVGILVDLLLLLSNCLWQKRERRCSKTKQGTTTCIGLLNPA